MNLAEKKDLYMKASDKYYNNRGRTKLTDAEFDKLEQAIRKADPKWDQLAKTGVAAKNKKTEVALEFLMPSLRKHYPDTFPKFLAKQQSVLLAMNKLDGGALQLTCDKGVPTKLVTRGDGTRGGDISFLIPHLNLPKRIALTTKVVFRCEALMATSTFDKKYANEFENARNLVNGWLNRKTPHEGLKDVDIVVLGMYGSSMHEGLRHAADLGFNVVTNARVACDTDFSALLAARRKKSKYAMDGLVVCASMHVFAYEDADKPKWVVAYKENEATEDATKATVVEILWQDSPKSRLIPKIKIKPVRIGGTTVTYATSHNAQWMIDKGIGPGAVVQLVRSGDVIPKIVGVIKKAEPQLPAVAYKQVGVHFVAVNRSAEADVRALHKFFKVMGIEFLATKTIATLYAEGFKTPQHYMKLWSINNNAQFLNAGIGKVMAAKIYAELNRVFKPGVLLRDLMVASNCFDSGLGDRKLRAIERFYKQDTNVLASLVKGDIDKLSAKLLRVPGFSDKSADLIVDGMPRFKAWLRKTLIYVKVRKPVASTVKAPVAKGKLTGFVVSFTTYRNRDHEKWVADNGGEVAAFGARTQYLIYRETGKANNKIEKAKAKGIKVCTFEALQREFK